MMKIVLVVIAFAAIAAAVPSEFTEEAPMLDLSQLEGEVSSDISLMKKKGATEADCKDLAKTSCEEVRREVKTNQGLINKLSTGSKCVTLGQGGITKMITEWKKTKRTHKSMKIRVSKALSSQIAVPSKRFSTLKVGECGFIFRSRGYLAAHYKYKRAVKLELSWRGRVSEAWKGVIRAKKTALRQVKKCQCSTKATALRLWKTVTSTKLVRKQNKAYAKCHMMACVLNGTPLSNRKCKGKLTKLRRKSLHSATKRAKC